VSDVTFATNYLNISYVQGDLAHQASVRANPSIKLFDIKEAGGASVESRFMLRGAAGMSGNLTDAQAIAAQNKNGRHYRWQVPFGKTRGSFRVAYEDIIQSKLDDAAEAKALDLEMEKGLAECGSKLVQLLFGRSGLAGGYGEYEETASGDYPSFAIRFEDPSDARNFQPGDNVVIAAGTGESSQSLVGDVGYVYDADVETGYIRVAALADPETPANPGSWVDDTNYYVFNLGLHGNGEQEDIIVPLEAYLPASRASDTFLGVPRLDSASLSGARLSSSEETGSITARIKRLIAKMRGRYTDLAKGANKVVLNAEDFGTVDEELTAQLGRSPAKTTEDGYESITINSANGSTELISEPYKNKGSGFILSPKNLKLYSALGGGKLLDLVKFPGGQVTRVMEGSNDLELRTFSSLANTVGAPFTHGRFSTTA
jgi:hypothetical protein